MAHLTYNADAADDSAARALDEFVVTKRIIDISFQYSLDRYAYKCLPSNFLSVHYKSILHINGIDILLVINFIRLLI